MRNVDENRNWGQRNGYGRGYGNGNKNQQSRAHGGSTTQTQTYYTTPKGRASYRNTPREMVMGMVKIKMIKIEKDIEILNMTLKKG